MLVAAALTTRAFAENSAAMARLSYRGFTIDESASQAGANLPAIETTLKHQIDIVADSGAKQEVLNFFRGRKIALKTGLSEDHGLFVPNKGVLIDDVPQPPEQPILLHELLHAYHFLVLPGGFQNSDVLRFYKNAKQGRRYKAKAYVLKNAKEFFAVTASLYLWGKIDRQPYTRENLKERQPHYYVWLGQLFGVEK